MRRSCSNNDGNLKAVEIDLQEKCIERQPGRRGEKSLIFKKLGILVTRVCVLVAISLSTPSWQNCKEERLYPTLPFHYPAVEMLAGPASIKGTDGAQIVVLQFLSLTGWIYSSLLSSSILQTFELLCKVW